MRPAPIKAVKFIALLALAIDLFFARPALTDDQVGNWGDPARLIIEGNKTFPANDIRSALTQNIDVQEGGHPLNILDGYCLMLKLKTTSGYLNAGFPRVKVVAHVDEAAQHMVLTIDEGPRFRCGEVIVNGSYSFAAAQLVNWLTTGQPPTDAVLTGFSGSGNKQIANWADTNGQSVELQSPSWIRGKPVPFDEAGTKGLHESVRRALAELGYPWAEFDVATPQDDATGTANLEINIKNAGSPAAIGHITITGNQRDSEQDVLKYLGVKLGSVLTESQRTNLWYKLWMSGRYLKHDVDIIAPADHAGFAELKVTLVEYDQAPQLAKPLTPVEQPLMKCREWILASKDRSEDWVCKFHAPASGCVVLSPKAGLLIHISSRKPDEKEYRELLGQIHWPEMVLAITPKYILYANSSAPKKLQLPVYDNCQLVMTVKIATCLNIAEPSHNFNFELGFGTNDISSKAMSPVDMKISIVPVWLFEIPRQADANSVKQQIEKQVLKLTKSYDAGEMIAQIDMPTGRFLSADWYSNDHLTHWKCTIEHGAFERELALADEHLQHRLTNKENAFDSKQTLFSLVKFLLNDPLVIEGLHTLQTNQQPSEKTDPLIHSLQKLIAAGLFKPLDDKIASWSNEKPANSANEDSDDFTIPDEHDNDQGFAAWLSLSERYYLSSTDNIFPRNSWPWIFSRAIVFSYAGYSTHWQADMNQLWQSNAFGPIGSWLVGMYYRMGQTSQDYQAARNWCQSGLHYSNTEQFHAEILPLLDRSKLCGKCIYHFAEVLQQLDQDDATTIGNFFLGEHGNLLGDAARCLQKNKNQPIETVLPSVLDQMWTDGLKSLVEARLQEFAGGGVEVAAKPRESEPQTNDAKLTPADDPLNNAAPNNSAPNDAKPESQPDDSAQFWRIR